MAGVGAWRRPSPREAAAEGVGAWLHPAVVGRPSEALACRGLRRHDRRMKSRVHPTYKTHYRVGNWRVYERALVSRGDVTLWLSPDARAAWIVPPSGRPGGQQRFSNLAIETALTLRLVFRLPLRQTEGYVRSLLTVMRAGLDAPDHTTLPRRSQLLDVTMHTIPAAGPLHLIVDSTGLSVVGEGEWAAAKHGGRGTRGWKKLHLGVHRAGIIVAQSLTEATVDDASVGADLIGAAAGDVASVTADAAYDTVAFYEAARARQDQVVVPPIMTARVSRHGPRSSVRDRTIADVETLGRRAWKKASGYHQQARVENAFFRYKSSSGLAFERGATTAASSRRALRAVF
jgi:IS5 family transposase